MSSTPLGRWGGSLVGSYQDGLCFLMQVPFPSGSDEECRIVEAMLHAYRQAMLDAYAYDDMENFSQENIAQDNADQDNANQKNAEEGDIDKEDIVEKVKNSETLKNIGDTEDQDKALWLHMGFVAVFWYDRDIIGESRIKMLEELGITQEELAKKVMSKTVDDEEYFYIPTGLLFKIEDEQKAVAKLEEFIVKRVSEGESDLSILQDGKLQQELVDFQEGLKCIVDPEKVDRQRMMDHLEWVVYEWYRHHNTKGGDQDNLDVPVCPRIKMYEKARIEKLERRLHDFKTASKAGE